MINQIPKYAVITGYYRDKVLKSIPLEILDNSENLKLIKTLSEIGTSSYTMLKYPISESSYIILSREQLDETFFEINVYDKNPDIITNIKPKKITKKQA